jgi:hypothetical protein
VITVRMMQVTVMQVVDVVAVPDRGMAAVGRMLVAVRSVLVVAAVAHGPLLPLSRHPRLRTWWQSGGVQRRIGKLG